ncbi:MAG: mucoidy inhibitor MuiA family protein [Alcanivorax sp.]
MRRFFANSSLVCMALVTVSPAMAKDIDVMSKVSAATVYNDRAALTRSAKIEIPAGEHNLVFKGLPVNLYTHSLRVEGSSKADVMFGALSHKRATFEDYVVPKERELNQKIEELQDGNKVLKAEKAALKTAKTFLENLGKEAVLRENENIAKIDLNPDSWGAAADSLASKVSENMKQSLALDIKIRETNEKIQKIQTELKQLRTGQKQSYDVIVPFESDKPTTLNIDLSYQVPGASWQPIYDARLNVKTGEMELIQYGSVWQRTGESWEDINLTLSTAQPSRGSGLPDLNPNWLSIYTPHRAQSRSMFGGASNEMATLSAMPAPGTDEEVAPAYIGAVEEQKAASLDRVVAVKTANINTEGFVGEYVITGPSTVASDGSKAKQLIGSFETENKVVVQVKPQLSTDAYLVVNATLKGEALVLPGQVSLFRDGAYIGQSYMKMLRPDDETELAFGIDDNVTVKRNTVKDERSEAGMITKDSVIERHYVTEIQNLHKTPVDIAVLEAIPSSKDERINIEILSEQTTPGYKTDLNNIKGVTRWMTTLQPKQQSTVKLGWKVSWPKGDNISGL